MQTLIDKLKAQGLVGGQLAAFANSSAVAEQSHLTSLDEQDLQFAIMLSLGMVSRPKLTAAEWWEAIQCMQRVTLGILRTPGSVADRRHATRFIMEFIPHAAMQIAILGDRSTDGTAMAALEEEGEQDGEKLVVGPTLFTAGVEIPADQPFDLRTLSAELHGNTTYEWYFSNLETISFNPFGGLPPVMFNHENEHHVYGANRLMAIMLPMFVEQLTAFFNAYQSEIKNNTGFFQIHSVYHALSNLVQLIGLLEIQNILDYERDHDGDVLLAEEEENTKPELRKFKLSGGAQAIYQFFTEVLSNNDNANQPWVALPNDPSEPEKQQ